MRAPIDIDVAVPGRALLGEGPRWDAARERLLWIDIYGHSVHALHGLGGDQPRESFWRAPAQVGCLAPTGGDELLVADADRLWLVDMGDGAARSLASFEHPFEDMRANDGACDPAGRMWVGTMHRRLVTGAGTLYCLRGGRLEPRVHGVTLSNGLDWSPDGTSMYYVDSATRRLDCFAFDVDSGELGRRVTVASFGPGDGTPDGLTVDHDGCVWLAMHGAGRLRRYTPRGVLDRTVALPADCPTACCFGGEDGATLFVTTAAMGLDEPSLLREPMAGAVLALHVGVSGPPAVPFDPST